MSIKNKKNVGIVFGLTKNLTFAVACVMLDLKEKSPDLADEIVIFHDGISIKQQTILNSILKCRFIKYKFPIKDKTKFNQETLRYFSKMVFSKFECLRLLNEYKNVIWLDYDIVINSDISELITRCDSGIKMMFPGCKVKDQLYFPINDYKMDNDGICGSCFVLQDHLTNYIEMYNFCYEKVEKYGNNLKMGEQAIFDFMIQQFKLDVSKIDHNLYSVHPSEKEKLNNAKIIHSAGSKKFWNEINNEHWNKNYKKYLKMGGQKYNYINYILLKRIKSALKKIGIYENIKKKILNIMAK